MQFVWIRLRLHLSSSFYSGVQNLCVLFNMCTVVPCAFRLLIMFQKKYRWCSLNKRCKGRGRECGVRQTSPGTGLFTILCWVWQNLHLCLIIKKRDASNYLIEHVVFHLLLRLGYALPTSIWLNSKAGW